MSDNNIIEIIFKAVVDKLKAGFDEAAEEVSTTTQSIQDSMQRASAGVASSSAAIGESLGGVTASVKETAAQYAVASQSMTRETQQMADMALVYDKLLEGNIESVTELAAADAALERLQAAGMISAEDYAAAIAMQGVAMEGLEKATRKAAIEEAKEAAAAEKLASAHNKAGAAALKHAAEEKEGALITGSTARELGIMTGEALRGNFARLEGSSITLANRMGLLPMVFSGVGAAVAAVIGVVGLLTYAMVEGEAADTRMNRAMVSTANYAGLSANAIDQLSESIAGGNVTIGEAREAVMKMVESGKLNQQQMQLGAAAARDMATVTGESMDKCREAIQSLADSPVQALHKLNEQYHFLTLAQDEEVQALIKVGDQTGAATRAIGLFGDAMNSRTPEITAQTGYIERGWDAVKGAISRAKDELLSWGRATTEADHIKQLTDELDGLREKSGVYSSIGDSERARLIASVQTQIGQWQHVIDGKQKAVEVEAEHTRVQQQGIDAANRFTSEFNYAMDKGTEKVEARKRALQELSAIHAANPNDEKTKGFKFDSNGQVIEEGKAYDSLLAGINKKYEEHNGHIKTAAQLESAAHREAMKAYEKEMNALGVKRDATKAASQERMDADAAIVAAAAKDYGKDSSQYRAALNQQKADKEAHDAEMRALDAQQADQVRTLSDMKIAADKAAYQAEYANGEISVAELYALEQQLIQRKLDADIAYYTKKKEIADAAGDTVGSQGASDAIVVATQSANDQTAQSNEEFRQTEQQKWEQYYGNITGAAANSVESMIFQGATLKQATKNFLASQLQNFIQYCGSRIAKNLATITVETGAHVAGNGIKMASDQLAAKQSVALNAGAAIKKIIANAAEVFTSVYKAIAGIPYVGPFLAPVMAVAAGAVVVGMVSKVASAERGWERVPADGMMTELHKDEQVLPAEYAEGLRTLVANGSNGGGGGDTHIHINAIDSRGVERWARDNSHILAGAVARHAGNLRK